MEETLGMSWKKVLSLVLITGAVVGAGYGLVKYIGGSRTFMLWLGKVGGKLGMKALRYFWPLDPIWGEGFVKTFPFGMP